MKLTIKRCFFIYKVIDENKKVVAKIKNKHFFSIAKKIVDLNGETIFTTDIINTKKTSESHLSDGNRKYLVWDKQRYVATAELIYYNNVDINAVQNVYFKLPNVEELNIRTDEGYLNIKHQSDNRFIIYDKNKVVGNISEVSIFKRHFIACSTIKNGAFLAALYILAVYMAGENNFLFL